MTEKTMLVTLADGTPIEWPAGLPEEFPIPHFDPNNLDVTIDEIAPRNYFSLELVQLLRADGDEVVHTVSHVGVEPVYDPVSDEKGAQGHWPLVVRFTDTPTGLVLNKTGREAVAAITSSRHVATIADRLKGRRLDLREGISKGRATIIITEAPGGREVPEAYKVDPVKAANDDFGFS